RDRARGGHERPRLVAHLRSRPLAAARAHALAAYVAEEVDALDHLHREEPPVVDRDELVEGDQVRVRDVRHRAELALEAVERRGVERGEGLERHSLPALVVVDLIDDAKPALPKAALDLEPARS